MFYHWKQLLCHHKQKTIEEELFLGLRNLIDLYYPSTEEITQLNIILNCGSANIKLPKNQNSATSEGYEFQSIVTC